MALLTAPPSWAHCTANFPALTSVSGPGNTSVTPGFSGADSATVAVFTLTHDVEYIVIISDGEDTTGVNNSCTMDLMHDPAGGTAWSVLIPDMLVGACLDSTNAGVGSVWYHFPLGIKAGTALGLRCSSANTTAGGVRTALWCYGGNLHPGSWWAGKTVAVIGMTTANQGTNHTAGNSGVYSSWADFGSPLARPAKAIQFHVQGTNTTVAANALNYLYEFGVAGQRIGPPIFRATNTTEAGWAQPPGPLWCDLAAGTQLQVRGTCSGTAQAHDVAAWVVS